MSPIDVENHLRIPVFLFTLLLFFQMITGLLLFHTHIGWSEQSVLTFYRLDVNANVPMSFSTFLQTASPHLTSMALISFLIIHFLAFVPNVNARVRWWSCLGLAFFTLLDILSGLVIIHVSQQLYWLKIFGFVGFQLFFVGCTIMMFLSFLPSLQSQSSNNFSQPASK